MKISIAASVLLSLPAVIAYTPQYFDNKKSLKKPSSSALRYVDPSAQDVDALGSAQVDLTSALSTKNDPFTTALAESLGVSDDLVRLEYANWLMLYDKAADETRYPTYKKNILLLAQSNRKYGLRFSLNEYGDFTEEENIQLMAASLEVSDDDVRLEYAKWLIRYEKAYDETRYPTFKKNIILLAQSNRDDGQTSSLNEYADLTEGTCRTWEVWLLLQGRSEECIQLKPNTAVIAEAEVEAPALAEQTHAPQLIEEDIEIIEDPARVEIVDEAEDSTATHATIEAVGVFKGLDFVKPVPQHYSFFSYVNEVPELRMEKGALCMDNWSIPDAVLSGAGSMPFPDYSTFAKGKSINKFGVTTSYLHGTSDMIEPFLDSEHNCAKEPRAQPRLPAEEDLLQEKYANIANLGDKAFQILVDLCMVDPCPE